MDDIDKYFDDDLVLDDETLAILDREEQKYLTQVQKHPSLPAVTKKLKTRDGWSPGVGSRVREDEFEDLPEISITTDGGYGFSDSAVAAAPVASNQFTKQPIAQSRANVTPAHLRPPFPRTQSARQGSSTHSRLGLVPDSRKQVHARTINTDTSSPRDDGGPASQSDLQKQICELQAQLSELKDQNQKIQDELKQATEARYAKEGEVSILRKNIEKFAQSHAADIARMKSAKEEADAKQKELERTMKEDIERLKTQFIFKQHELEASLRKPPASTRPVRIMKNVPATPVRVPDHVRMWKGVQEAETSRNSQETPARSPRGHVSSKQKVHTSHFGELSPERTRKSAFLPGFQNSFLETPLKLGHRVDLKGKEKNIEREQSLETSSQNVARRHLPPIATPARHGSEDDWDIADPFNIGMSSDDPAPRFDEDGDTVMVDDSNEGEIEPVESINRKAELSRILMTHTHKHENEPTFQLMIGLAFSQRLTATDSKNCTIACQAILAALAHPADDSDYPACASLVTKSLIMILRILLNVDPCQPVASLFSLLVSLTLSLPTLNKVILVHEVEEGQDSLMLITICEFAKHLIPEKSNIARAILGEILSLLNILCCDVPDEMITRLSYIPKQMDCFNSLLETSQPLELTAKFSQVLLFLATYNTLHPRLVMLPEDVTHQEDQLKDSTLISHLCTYLVESQDCEPLSYHTVHSNLLCCLAQISLTQAEALVESHFVIPALVFFVAHQATTLWNDERFIPSSQANSLIRAINQGLFLLHHLIYGNEPNAQLHQKLQQTPNRSLDNLVHMFVVSFGQLSYSDPPDWIDSEGKAELEGLAETARELLDLVVDGPEGDGVWAAFQMDPEHSSETDEEEREARRMEDDMES